jgi:hypothetical protein
MAITKINNYVTVTGNNLTSLALNVDYLRLQEDRIQITVNYAGSPATVTIKKGSLIEVNGNLYLITSDYSFAMTNATHNYLTFTDSPTPAFSSATAKGTYSIAKAGYYQIDNLTKTLKFYVDQAGLSSFELIDIIHPDKTIKTKRFDYVKAGMTVNQNISGILQLNTTYFDELGHFNTGTYRYVCSESGYYLIVFKVNVTISGGTFILRKNAATYAVATNQGYTGNLSVIMNIIKNDYIDIDFIPSLSSAAIAGETNTYLEIARLL